MRRCQLLSAFGGTLLLAFATFAAPPPRAERTPWVLHWPGRDTGTPAPFFQAGWRPGYTILAGWAPRYFYYATKYDVVPTPYGPIIETYADGTASWISRPFRHVFQGDETTCINWVWSADQLPDLKADERSMAGDDFAIRLYVFGRLETGESYGFDYVWSVQSLPGDVWTSPFTANKLMALRKGPNPTGVLVGESRNLIGDLEYALGVRPADIRMVVVMTDSEGSDSVARGRIWQIATGECIPDMV